MATQTAKETAKMIIALIPAHNEQGCITQAIESLKTQEHPPDKIYVVADRCTDQTVPRAIAAGASIIPIAENHHKKAGALNQALDLTLPGLADSDSVLVQDADTRLSPSFTATASAALTGDVGAVGGIFYGEPGASILGAIQRNEYTRYGREIARRGGRAVVLTGTATLFRVRVLREIREASKSGRIPGGPGYYTTSSLTEDDFITKAIKTLGYRTLSPRGCEVETEVMPSVRQLWRQRLRWQWGALENIRLFGLTRVTAPYAVRQALTGLGAAVFLLLVVMTALSHSWAPSPFWLAIGSIFVAERIITVRSRGWRAMLLAASMIPETVFDLFLSAVYFKALWNTLTRKTANTW